MRKLNKKGIEITLNFIVMLILAIAILSGSLVLMRQFFASAEETKASIDSQTDSQIRSMLAGGSKVAIPVNRVSVNKKDLATFGVGILNVLKSGGESDEFTISSTGCVLSGSGVTISPYNSPQVFDVAKNDQQIFLIGFKVRADAPSGTYICNIYVKLGNVDYAESVYKAYIVVE